MPNNFSLPALSKCRTRYGFVAFWLLSLLVSWSLLRLVLFTAFKPEAVSPAALLLLFGAGFYRDLIACVFCVLPVLFWILMVPARLVHARWQQVLLWLGSLVCGVAITFLLFVEFFFFQEFRSRFNTVAVDYLIYPHEVFINIWESYPVGWVLLVCLILAILWVMAAAKLFRRIWEPPHPPKHRLGILLGAGAVCAFVAITAPLKSPRISADRSLNEMANNGALSFVSAVLTHHLDYAGFYRTIPQDEAYQRVRDLLADSHSTLVEEGHSIRRRIAGDPTKPRLNVVLFLEESLGSEFWGSLGRKEQTLTPNMDKLAAEEGMLFTNIYASGNRTVRGMEGVLASLPPLPGDSIVKRDLSDNVETIARVLKRDGYSTLFLYGGRGLFDGMRSFALRNGYDRFIEQKHFDQPAFSTIWGVCDEDLFKRTLQECVELSHQEKPFFATVLTVSNHKPYTYPKGRIPEDPNLRKRKHVVKYADYALGEFFKAAKHEALWTNTVFVVVADHGARVYGSQTIPIRSYEIPFLIAGPAVVKAPSRPGMLGCSTDVAPTILGLIGRPYESLFFGEDLLNCQDNRTRAFLNHNRDIGMLSGNKLVVLGLMRGEEFYAGNPKHSEMRLLTGTPSEPDCQLAREAIAFYQVADELYTQQRYRLDGTGQALIQPARAPSGTTLTGGHHGRRPRANPNSSEMTNMARKM